jgi:hypothetical protein
VRHPLRVLGEFTRRFQIEREMYISPIPIGKRLLICYWAEAFWLIRFRSMNSLLCLSLPPSTEKVMVM